MNSSTTEPSWSSQECNVSSAGTCAVTFIEQHQEMGHNATCISAKASARDGLSAHCASSIARRIRRSIEENSHRGLSQRALVHAQVRLARILRCAHCPAQATEPSKSVPSRVRLSTMFAPFFGFVSL